MNNVLLINCLVQELQNNPALLTDSVIGSLADKIANTIITLSALVDPNSPVWDFLYGQIILLEGKLIEVTGSVTDGTLSTLQTMGGWSKKMVYDFVPDLSGVYLFEFISDGTQYLGSSTNLYGRTLQHIANLHKGLLFNKTGVCEGGLTVWNWGTVYLTPNFTLDFIKANPYYSLLPVEYLLLQHFTQFLPRILEQSLLLRFKFGYNGTSIVGASHFNPRDPRGINIVGCDSNTVLCSYPTITAAGYATGLRTSNNAKFHLRRGKTISNNVTNSVYGQSVKLKSGKAIKNCSTAPAGVTPTELAHQGDLN